MDALLHWFTPLAGFALVLYIGVLLVGYVTERFRPATPKPLTDAHIRQAVLNGQPIVAIRYHRELHNSSLAVAKATIDKMVADTKARAVSSSKASRG